jgi:F-type H+-transporting ATPase subunit delta
LIRRFARPYATAILDVAGSAEAARKVYDELVRFERARKSSSDLEEVFANPGIDAAAKLAIASRIAGRIGLSPLTLKVLEILINNHRINDLGAIAEGLSIMIHNALDIVIAEVSTAHQLDPAEVRELTTALEKKTGKTVEVQLRTDPTLLGGMVARIGSEIFNASVSGRIEKLRHNLT